MALKPLALIALFGSARLIAYVLNRVMPPSKFKTWLFQEKGPL